MPAEFKSLLAPGLLALCMTVIPVAGVHAASWTFTPELRRLDADGSELPSGPVDVARHQVLRVGLYVAVMADGDASAGSAHLGFESLSGAIHFSGETLDASDIGPVVRSLRGGHGWERRMSNASFDPVADGWLGPPEEGENETSWIAFWSDPTNVQANPRGAWCAGEAGNCSIFVGVLTISVAQLPADAVGDLSLRFGGVDSAEEHATVSAMFGRAEETVAAGNTITYNICPASGCAVADESTEPDRESRALAMKFALAGFGREVGGNVVDMIGERADMNAAGPAETYLALGGRPVDVPGLGFGQSDADNSPGWLASVMEILGVNLNSQDGLAWEAARATGISSGYLNFNLLPSARDLLTGSSFEIGLGGDDRAPGKWTLWGAGGDMDAFGGQPDDRFSMDGEVFAGHIGIDYRFSEAILAGVIVSRTTGGVDYRFRGPTGDDGDIALSLTSAHPYLHWSPFQGLGVWGSVGFGRGGATLTDEKGSADTGIGLTMTAVGARRELMPIGRFELAVKADAFFVTMESEEHEHLPAASADASRMRLALESSRSFAFEGGSMITGTMELGALADAGDAETGTGAELGAGLAYQHPGGIDIQARGHMLLTHQESEFEQWGASLSVTFDWGPQGEGLFFALAPSWGAPATGAEGMWETTRVAESFLAGEPEQGVNLDTRVGYGLNLPNGRGLLTLFGEMGRPTGAPLRLRLGTQLARMELEQSPLNLEVFAERMGAAPGAEPAYGIVINARGGF
ncbi:MAG: hypothetical protein F4Z95_10270 [Gammaproteobacteria bacterium]|nr:hypothetical protein [Gammaproteobacteria bacterium]